MRHIPGAGEAGSSHVGSADDTQKSKRMCGKKKTDLEITRKKERIDEKEIRKRVPGNVISASFQVEPITRSLLLTIYEIYARWRVWPKTIRSVRFGDLYFKIA